MQDKFNIFQGSRRITKIIQIISLIVVWNINTDSSLNYIIISALCYFGILFVSVIIGWIVRGVFNIPFNQDSKNI